MNPLLLPKIEAGTKGGELNKVTFGDRINVNSGSATKNTRAVKFLLGTKKGMT